MGYAEKNRQRTDVTDEVPYKTLKDVELLSAFYKAVEEYRYVLANGNFDKAYHFMVSRDAAEDVAAKLYELAVKRSGNKRVRFEDDLKVLPADIYQTLGFKNRWFIVNNHYSKKPVAGSQTWKEYDESLSDFRLWISEVVAHSYGLPNRSFGTVNSRFHNAASIFSFTGDSDKTAKTKVFGLNIVKNAFLAFLFLSVATPVFMIAVQVFSPPLIALITVLFLVVGGLVAINLVEGLGGWRYPLFKSSSRLFLTFGVFRGALQDARKNFGVHVKPYLASMDSFLLQEKEHGTVPTSDVGELLGRGKRSTGFFSRF